MNRTALGLLVAMIPLVPVSAWAQGPGTGRVPQAEASAATVVGSDPDLATEHRIPLRSRPLPGPLDRATALPESHGLASASIQRGPGPRQNLNEAARGPGSATSFLSSLLLPGSAQWMHGQNRSYLYLGLEVLGWIGFLHERHQGADYRDGYRDLARTYALLAHEESGAPGGFGYYETLGEWVASGAWDVEPGTEGLQPEMNPDTYNGSIWSLATDLYLSGEGGTDDPEAYRRALLYYQERAYPPEQGWDWSGNTARMAWYRDLIERSDESFRRSTVILGAVVANHLLSAVDGFLSSRLSFDRTLRFSSTVRPDPAAPGGTPADLLWSFQLRLNAIP